MFSSNTYDVTLLHDETKDGVRVIFVRPCNDVCTRQIAIAIKDGIILDAEFVGGCSGNTNGIVSLIKGMKVEDVISRLEGIKCGVKGTSCPDQLAKALKLTLQQS